MEIASRIAMIPVLLQLCPSREPQGLCNDQAVHRHLRDRGRVLAFDSFNDLKERPCVHLFQHV